MRSFGYPVIFDVTQPATSRRKGTSSEARGTGPFAQAAVAAGVDRLFMEVHPEPSKALCDGHRYDKVR